MTVQVTQLESTVEKMSTKILDLERAFRSGSLAKSSFGRKEVKSSDQYIFRSPGPKFNGTIDTLVRIVVVH